jgi:aldose 1-epimerase
VIDPAPAGLFAPIAELSERTTGRTMSVFTDQPGVQLYTGNHLQVAGRANAVYGPYSGLCLETQRFPDSPNHPEFPSCLLRAGETFRSTTIYQFSAK